MKGLAERGHNVTMISPLKAAKPIENYTEVFIENSYDRYLKCKFNFFVCLFFINYYYNSSSNNLNSFMFRCWRKQFHALRATKLIE